jgi:AGCS family alanine or glycine:cation symporter
MRYLKVGLAERGMAGFGTVLSIVFAVLCVGASFGGGNAYQVGQSLGVLQQSSELSFLRQMPWIYGLVMAVAVGAVIIGGIKSIANVAEKIVPFMCGAYLLACSFIILANVQMVPRALASIFIEAFTPQATIAGGFIGVMVWGIKRAVFSNEAGVGSAAIAHSAARTEEPISEGIVALLEPFIDTVVVCTCTALTIVITGVYATPEGQVFAQDSNGAALTRLAFQQGGYHWFEYILFMSVVLFAYSTCISWSYYGERCFVRLFGDRMSMVYKVLFLFFTLLGSIVSQGNILDFSDTMILAMSIPNLIGVYIMSGHVRSELDKYWIKYQNGELEPSAKLKKHHATT